MTSVHTPNISPVIFIEHISDLYGKTVVLVVCFISVLHVESLSITPLLSTAIVRWLLKLLWCLLGKPCLPPSTSGCSPLRASCPTRVQHTESPPDSGAHVNNQGQHILSPDCTRLLRSYIAPIKNTSKFLQKSTQEVLSISFRGTSVNSAVLDCDLAFIRKYEFALCS